MLHCFQCGHDLPDNLAFCLHCGAKLDDETPTVVHPTPSAEPHVYTPKQSSGVGKFILGSLLGGMAVILLLVIGAFVLYSMRNGEKPLNVPVNNTNPSSPTPARSPTPKKPTPTPSPSAVNGNSEAVTRKTCTIVNPAGGKVNLRGYCDVKNCQEDADTIYLQADPGETVELTGKKPVKTGRFTWVQVRYNDDVVWISSTRLDCG